MKLFTAIIGRDYAAMIASVTGFEKHVLTEGSGSWGNIARSLEGRVYCENIVSMPTVLGATKIILSSKVVYAFFLSISSSQSTEKSCWIRFVIFLANLKKIKLIFFTTWCYKHRSL